MTCFLCGGSRAIGLSEVGQERRVPLAYLPAFLISSQATKIMGRNMLVTTALAVSAMNVPVYSHNWLCVCMDRPFLFLKRPTSIG